jgi:hypothetical protein
MPGFIRVSISNKTIQLTKKKTLGKVSGKTNCHWVFIPGYRVHQPHTCPNRFSYEQTGTSSLVEITPIQPSTRRCCMHSTQTYKTYEAYS